MRALTLKPHWAYAVAHMGKRIENRSRPIPKALVGQRVAIHAGSEAAIRRGGWMIDLIAAGQPPVSILDKCRGIDIQCRAIVATAVLSRFERPMCRTFDEMRSPPPAWAFVDSPYWWHLTEVITLANPVHVQKGQLGLWHLPEDISKQLESAA